MDTRVNKWHWIFSSWVPKRIRVPVASLMSLDSVSYTGDKCHGGRVCSHTRTRLWHRYTSVICPFYRRHNFTLCRRFNFVDSAMHTMICRGVEVADRCSIHVEILRISMVSHPVTINMITRKPSCRWQTRATRCNVFVAPSGRTSIAISTKSTHRWKVRLGGYNSVADSTGLSPFV